MTSQDAETDESGAEPKGIWGVLSTRNVALYVAGLSLSNIGTWAYNISASILVFRLTGSALLVGLVSSAQFAGFVVLAPWAGSAADRFDRRRLLMVLQTGSALIAGALAIVTATGNATAPIVVATSALLGFALAFTTPALHALVPSLVDAEHIESVVALNSVGFNLARAVGPVLGTALIALSGLSAAFAFNAASFLVFVATIGALRLSPQASAESKRGMFRDSLRYAWNDRDVRLLLLTVAAVATSVDPVTTLAPEFATRVFSYDDSAAGILVGAFGAGATLTALTVLARLRHHPRSLEVAMSVEGLFIVGFAVAPGFGFAVAFLAIAGGGFIASVAQATARIHRIVPRERIGRVMAIWGLAFLGSRPVAALVDGAIADTAGARTATLILATPVLVVTGLWLRKPSLRGTIGHGSGA